MLRRSLLRLPPLPSNARAKFCTSSTKFANRAIVYTETGNPATVLTALTYPSLPPPPPNSLNIRIRLAPINPADINVIEGVYPAKPALTGSLSPGQELTKPVYVGGNEALAEILQVGSGVEGLKKGDWVIMAKQQAGTWSSARTVDASDVIKLPADTLSEVNAATITVNPPTAYNMLRDFVELGEGDWVLQNGANSAVGQAVIQIAASRGLKTINFVRNRPDIDALKKQLSDLGATHVLTYDDLSDKALSRTVKQWTEDRPIRLMLNCVGGKPTAQMTRFLGTDAHLVSYGAMSKQPLALPTSAFIFKNLVAHGFWQSRWYDTHSRAEREALMHALAALKLKEPEHEIVTVLGWMSDVEAKEKNQKTRDSA
ncbi:putative trans-2-enoyl-CoA reductase, mitochondrial [Grifola frondosa]|uniref:enoyl-[acyl-carrier-protein] reductase n=1 Tax=Grifola frondosa TaxID=5627 RepID=A0A1C7MCV9_GRIFR|nr:putative trans-2-enoyl-CoA reductase, mitochondrial [Grifola frondosa]